MDFEINRTCELLDDADGFPPKLEQLEIVRPSTTPEFVQSNTFTGLYDKKTSETWISNLATQ
ncbi:hypothetical protein DFQ26_000980, partial [Actinomortierella ambigua]